jgi:hypothetical protein
MAGVFEIKQDAAGDWTFRCSFCATSYAAPLADRRPEIDVVETAIREHYGSASAVPDDAETSAFAVPQCPMREHWRDTAWTVPTYQMNGSVTLDNRNEIRVS